MKRMRKATRREFLSAGLGGVALAVGAGGLANLIGSTTFGEEETPSSQVTIPELPWKYQYLDPVAAAERSYKAYSKGGCMYGAFEGILGELREQAGFPFTAFPALMMEYGKAGVVGWGTLCGALNGAAALIYLVSEPQVRDKLIDELYSWYGQTPLPIYEPQNKKFTIDTSVSNSPLCHNSVTRWCEATGFKALSPERAERCGQLTGSVAKFTVELLNAQTEGTFAPVNPIPGEVKGCLSCHGKGGMVENVHAAKGVSCTPCHTVLPSSHPGR